MTPHYDAERMRKTLLTLRCPSCGAENLVHQKPMLEMDAQGRAYCNACAHLWTVEEKTS